MKKVFYLGLICGLSLILKTKAQAPVGFPDGITVGTRATIPVGST
jgi:hypothetical protein